MKNSIKSYINGLFIAPNNRQKITVINPATEQPIAEIPLGTAEDIDMAVEAAKNAFVNYSRTSIEERISLLKKLLKIYELQYEKMAKAISQEMGAPINFARKEHAASGADHLETIIDVLSKYSFTEDIGSTRIFREPIGVCGCITPWNWPINQIVCKVAPALAVGCTVVLKPSEIAPLSAYLFAKMIDETGFPPGVFNLVNGDGMTTGAALSAHPDIDMISFTGSTRAGILIAQAAAPTVKRVTQELGGKSANILLDDADIENYAFDGAAFCFSNSGQTCNAPTRMLVPQDRHNEAVLSAIKAASMVKMGDPTDAKIEIGPVVSENQYNKIQRYIEKGIDEGATLSCGGLGKPTGLETGFYVKPTLFSNVRNEMTIAQEEIFGPVLVIIPYENEEQAVRIANDSPYGLSGYVCSGNLERAQNVASMIRAGSICINGAAEDVKAPFGGYKMSGNGREYGVYGMEEYLETKSISGYR